MTLKTFKRYITIVLHALALYHGNVGCVVLDMNNVGQLNFRNAGTVLGFIEHTGFILCARMCERYHGCNGFNFHKNKLWCELLRKNPLATHEQEGWRFVDGTAWLQASYWNTGTENIPCEEMEDSKVKLKNNDIHCFRPQIPVDCEDPLITDVTSNSGVYRISPLTAVFDVYCEFDIANGEIWTMIQRRVDGSVDFYQKWAEYQYGFGNLLKDFWLGNEWLHQLQAARDYILKCDMEEFDGDTTYAIYNTFRVSGVSTNYTLTVNHYTGNADDSLADANNKRFHTWDRDNVRRLANIYKTGWWLDSCPKTNLNGEFYSQSQYETRKGIFWKDNKCGNSWSLKSVSMKIRRRSN